MPRRYYSSTAARTTLASGVNDSATSFSVVAVSGWPESFPYTLIVDQDTVNEEIVQVTARSGTSLTVVRAVDGTTGVAHSAGAAVNHGVSARDFNEPNQFLNEGGTLTGATVVEVNSTSPALRVTQTGTGNALVVEDSTNPDATPFVVDAAGNVLTSGKVLIGESSSYTVSATGRLQVSGTTDAHVSLARFTANNAGGTFNFGKSRGTEPSSLAVVSNGDSLGDITWNGDDGNNFVTAARILGQVDGTPGTNDMPGRLQFFTTADGSATPTERMRITQAGNVGIGTSSPAWALDIHAPQPRIGLTDTDTGVDHRIDANSLTGDFAILVDYNSEAADPDFNISIKNQERLKINSAGLITGTGTSLGAWTAYTPTLGGTGWAIGNGTAAGAYCQIGKVVHFRVKITFNSTSTYGAGSLTVSLPVTAASGSQDQVTCSSGASDSSAGTAYALNGVVASTTTMVLRGITSAAGLSAGVSTNVPFTWATGDSIRFSATYETA